MTPVPFYRSPTEIPAPPLLPVRTSVPLKARPVAEHWECQQSGECCTLPAEVIMSNEERTLLMRKAPDGIVSHWRKIDEKLWALKAAPCPFYVFKTCLVYEHRPFNCRRFACMRPDPKTEPFERGGLLGCLNMEIRIRTSRVVRRQMELIQRKAQRWARAHGWTEEASS